VHPTYHEGGHGRENHERRRENERKREKEVTRGGGLGFTGRLAKGEFRVLRGVVGQGKRKGKNKEKEKKKRKWKGRKWKKRKKMNHILGLIWVSSGGKILNFQNKIGRRENK